MIPKNAKRAAQLFLSRRGLTIHVFFMCKFGEIWTRLVSICVVSSWCRVHLVQCCPHHMKAAEEVKYFLTPPFGIAVKLDVKSFPSPYSAHHPAFVSVYAHLPVKRKFFTSHPFCESLQSFCIDPLNPICSAELLCPSSLRRFLQLFACSSQALSLLILLQEVQNQILYCICIP